MRLKEILREVDKEPPPDEELFSKLDRIVESGDWIIKEPWLYRGRDWDDYVKVKDTEVYDRRKTRDTGDIIDYIIHDYTVGCYPDYPDRWQSRFALTYSGDATTFGDENYVIFPHKNSKIVHSNVDSYDILVSRGENAKGKLLDVTKRFYTDNKKKRPAFTENEDQIDENIQNLISGIYDIVRENKEVSIAEYGCPEDIMVQLEELITKFSARSRIRGGLIRLRKAYKDVIAAYFNLYRDGYPPEKEEGKGEVMYQGKYVQVYQPLWERYLEKRDVT